MLRLRPSERAAAIRRLDARKRRRGRKRPLTVEPPARLAVEYERQILRMQSELWRMIDRWLLPALKAAGRTDGVRQDASISAVLVKMRRRMAAVFTTAKLKATTARYADEVDKRHRAEFYRQLTETIGVDVLAVEPFHSKLVAGWRRENVALIKSVRDTSVKAIGQEVEAALSTGLRHEALRDRWIERGIPVEFGTVEGRAKVIARDQISKLNGQLTRARQENVGIKRYTWRTAGDARVRDSHEALNGRTFAWNKPPSEGHPGDAVLCRCVAEAVIDIDEIAAAQNLLPVKASDLELLGGA